MFAASTSTFGLGVLVCCLLMIGSSGSLKVGSFNIRTFGKSKLAKEAVMGYIEQILRRYDVVLVMELKDTSGTVISGVLDRLNSNGEEWNVTYSERLGKSSSSYKEQYAFYYRTNQLTLLDSYQFDDGVDDGSETDIFSREPFGALFSSSKTGDLAKFGLLGVHIAPDEAVPEIDALVEVFADAKQHWNVEDIMVMGDFNADCGYVNKGELAKLKLKNDPSYLWLIGDDADTTVSATDCAYDRMIATGDQLKKAINVTSARVYRYDDELNLDEEMAKDVSDHYPVEVVIPFVEPPGDSRDTTGSANTSMAGLSTVIIALITAVKVQLYL